MVEKLLVGILGIKTRDNFMAKRTLVRRLKEKLVDESFHLLQLMRLSSVSYEILYARKCVLKVIVRRVARTLGLSLLVWHNHVRNLVRNLFKKVKVLSMRLVNL